MYALLVFHTQIQMQRVDHPSIYSWFLPIRWGCPVHLTMLTVHILSTLVDVGNHRNRNGAPFTLIGVEIWPKFIKNWTLQLEECSSWRFGVLFDHLYYEPFLVLARADRSVPFLCVTLDVRSVCIHVVILYAIRKHFSIERVYVLRNTPDRYLAKAFREDFPVFGRYVHRGWYPG